MCSIAPPPPLRQEKDDPEVAALLARIEEKALRREVTGRPGSPLVSRSISHRAPLPTWGLPHGPISRPPGRLHI